MPEQLITPEIQSVLVLMLLVFVVCAGVVFVLFAVGCINPPDNDNETDADLYTAMMMDEPDTMPGMTEEEQPEPMIKGGE